MFFPDFFRLSADEESYSSGSGEGVVGWKRDRSASPGQVPLCTFIGKVEGQGQMLLPVLTSREKKEVQNPRSFHAQSDPDSAITLSGFTFFDIFIGSSSGCGSWRKSCGKPAAAGQTAVMCNVGGWHLTGTAKIGEEYFYPRRHPRWEKWGGLTSDAIPDHILLATGESDRPTFQPTQLSHVTTFSAAKEIFSSGRFTSQQQKKIGEKVTERFSWWSFEIDQPEIERERNKYREIIDRKAQSTDVLSHCFSSPAFQRGSRYGNFKFTYDILSLMDMYQDSVCAGEPPEVRVLGTFKYKLEVMHAVVVCCPGTSLFSDCPDIPSDPEAVLSKSDQGWTWRPDSTGETIGPGTIYFPISRPWDHIGVAFHLPGGCPGFPLPPGVPPLTYCEIIKPNISGSDPITREEFDQCSEELREIWE